VIKWVTGRDLIEYDNGFFNWTLTYKTDADVYIPYREMMGTFYGRIRKGKADVDRILAKKTKLVVSVIAMVTGSLFKEGILIITVI